MLQFFDICVIVLVLLLITQVLIPSIWPKDFQKWWLFRKKKPIDKADDLINKKSLINNEIAEAKQKLLDEADNVNKAEEKINKL